MEKYFNIAGPCFPNRHYMLPALDRMPEVRRLVEQEMYFVIHAPRQTGKTTAVKALASEINAKGEMVALYCTLETLQGMTDPVAANSAIHDLILDNAHSDPSFPSPLDVHEGAPPAYGGNGIAVRTALRTLCREAEKPVAVFFDEADCLCGQVLISFLRQLRDGYVNRESVPFPASIALIGMLDVRDYKAQIRPDGESLGQINPFNVITEDLMLRNFTEKEVAALYAQHTEATGQVFEPEALAAVWKCTRGQPWLVNALARVCVEKNHNGDYAAPITAADILTAKETIIRRRDTHVDSLMERLREPRVRRVVEPVILGKDTFFSSDDADCRLALDLGLLRVDEHRALVPGNAMYGEILLRYLSDAEQNRFYNLYRDPFWIKPDGTLDMPALMDAFQAFWRENSGADRDLYGFKEATPHLVMAAFLQRVVNGGGRITREMAIGRKRLDICIEYGQGRYVVELKMKRQFGPDSLGQLAGYLADLGLDEGWMAVFDNDAAKSWDEKIFRRDETFNGQTIHIVGL
jgi:hypothetical protein